MSRRVHSFPTVCSIAVPSELAVTIVIVIVLWFESPGLHGERCEDDRSYGDDLYDRSPSGLCPWSPRATPVSQRRGLAGTVLARDRLSPAAGPGLACTFRLGEFLG